MFRLLEITFANDKESQAIYPYETKDDLEGEYESKLGLAMLNNSDSLLIGVDNLGQAIFLGKSGSHDFSPRLYEAKSITGQEEAVDLAKYDDENTLHARYHTKKGAAIKNANCTQENLLGFDGNGGQLEYCHWVRTDYSVMME